MALSNPKITHYSVKFCLQRKTQRDNYLCFFMFASNSKSKINKAIRFGIFRSDYKRVISQSDIVSALSLLSIPAIPDSLHFIDYIKFLCSTFVVADGMFLTVPVVVPVTDGIVSVLSLNQPFSSSIKILLKIFFESVRPLIAMIN